MTIRIRVRAAAGALAVGILGAALGVPATAHAAVTAAPSSAQPAPADPYRQGFRKGLLVGDDAAEKQCAYDSSVDYGERPPRPAPFDPATAAVPRGHSEEWGRGYREGLRRGWTDGIQYYCAHGS
ncbi:hypothetical protein [Actinoplanes sp. NPDC026623]|uniref:hypothetical protein n=1 Tax=Actinoplanes sp. NPDC026623 TaxID=3155610 RepID=UPI0033F805F1